MLVLYGGSSGVPSGHKGGQKEPFPQGMLVLLFRKKTGSWDEAEISQQQQCAKNILLQNEGGTGIYHEARPRGEKVKVSRSAVSDCDLVD